MDKLYKLLQTHTCSKFFIMQYFVLQYQHSIATDMQFVLIFFIYIKKKKEYISCPVLDTAFLQQFTTQSYIFPKGNVKLP